jgi:hypothetical protein
MKVIIESTLEIIKKNKYVCKNKLAEIMALYKDVMLLSELIKYETELNRLENEECLKKGLLKNDKDLYDV